ncbi:MAG: TetR/AcrR family transcriptional regulator [Halanaerobiales bacterium]|nr:TetR/AcrR family transcriptional regulator [Halanaerobiales bacterium]
MNTDKNKISTKDRILAVSENLFAEKGFDSTGIDEIASNVGIAKSVIYYHFKNKEDILKTLFEKYLGQGFELKKDKIDEIVINDNVNYKKIFSETLNRAELWRNFSRILFMESMKKTDPENNLLFKLWERNMEFLYVVYKDKLNDQAISKKKELLTKSFFMLGLPWIGFQVFVASWSEFVDIEEEELNKMLTEIMDEFLEKIWLEKLFNL